MRILCAFNVNLDAVHDVTGDELTELVGSRGLLPGSPLPRPQIVLPERITTVEDLMSGLLASVGRGAGAEQIVEGEVVTAFLKGAFSWGYRAGGNAGNMANVLANLGAEPVLNVPAPTPRQASFLHPLVRVPTPEGALEEPIKAARPGDDLVHYVFEFARGTEVMTPEGVIVSPEGDRFIATRDPLNCELYADPAFEAYASENLTTFCGALVSGFHLVPYERGGRGFRDIMKGGISTVNGWKERWPGLYVHAEMGHFERPEMMSHLMESLWADSVGLNEVELAMLTGSYGGWTGALDGVRSLCAFHGLRRICVHTRDYVLSVMDGLMPPEREVEALAYGSDVAALLAETGRLEAEPETKGLDVSVAGSDAVEEFLEEYGGSRSGRGAYASYDGLVFSLVPSLAVESPRVTVGLGDTMTASAYYKELAAISGQSP